MSLTSLPRTKLTSCSQALRAVQARRRRVLAPDYGAQERLVDGDGTEERGQGEGLGRSGRGEEEAVVRCGGSRSWERKRLDLIFLSRGMWNWRWRRSWSRDRNAGEPRAASISLDSAVFPFAIFLPARNSSFDPAGLLLLTCELLVVSKSRNVSILSQRTRGTCPSSSTQIGRAHV